MRLQTLCEYGCWCVLSSGGLRRPASEHPTPYSLLRNHSSPSFCLGPLSALFLAIDSQCRLQDMDEEAHAAMAEDDEVVYYVNMDSAGWVEQHVRRHVYLELKLECTRNRMRNEHRARDDWVCLYCRNTIPSKLRLTDHRCGGCPWTSERQRDNVGTLGVP